MKTTHDKIYVKEIVKENVTHGGIYIPSAVSLQIKKGEVVEVGPGRLNANGNREPMSTKVGDIVLYGAHSGMPIEWKKDGETVKVFVMPEIEVIGIFQEGEE